MHAPALQVLRVLKHAFDGVRLGLRLSHYRVIPTRTGARLAPGGILEVVPDVRSRDEIGKVRRGASEGPPSVARTCTAEAVRARSMLALVGSSVRSERSLMQETWGGGARGGGRGAAQRVLDSVIMALYFICFSIVVVIVIFAFKSKAAFCKAFNASNV
jgi:hypothetical protein